MHPKFAGQTPTKNNQSDGAFTTKNRQERQIIKLVFRVPHYFPYMFGAHDGFCEEPGVAQRAQNTLTARKSLEFREGHTGSGITAKRNV